MEMYNPPTLREFIAEIYLKPKNVSTREFSEKLGISRSTLNRLLNGQRRIDPPMAERLSMVTGRSVGSWLRLQEMQDRWQERLRNAA
jgi:addiction module HigA family antidote